MKFPIVDKGTPGRPKLTEADKLQNKIASSIELLIKHKLEVLTHTIYINMSELKNMNDEELKKNLGSLSEHVYHM